MMNFLTLYTVLVKWIVFLSSGVQGELGRCFVSLYSSAGPSVRPFFRSFVCLSTAGFLFDFFLYVCLFGCLSKFKCFCSSIFVSVP